MMVKWSITFMRVIWMHRRRWLITIGMWSGMPNRRPFGEEHSILGSAANENRFPGQRNKVLYYNFWRNSDLTASQNSLYGLIDRNFPKASHLNLLPLVLDNPPIRTVLQCPCVWTIQYLKWFLWLSNLGSVHLFGNFWWSLFCPTVPICVSPSPRKQWPSGIMVTPTGLEPVTSRLGIWRSILMSYGAVLHWSRSCALRSFLFKMKWETRQAFNQKILSINFYFTTFILNRRLIRM